MLYRASRDDGAAWGRASLYTGTVPWHDYREKATRARWNADKRADSVALNE